MNLPEVHRIQLFSQLLDGRFDKRLRFRCGDTGVLLVGLEVEHVVGGDETHGGAQGGLDPAQVLEFARRARMPGQAGERILHILRRRVETQLQAIHGSLQALLGDGLQQVVHRPLLEGLDGVFVVGRDEDDVAQIAHFAGHVDTGNVGHADVEKQHVRLVLPRIGERVLTAAGFQHHVQFRPDIVQPAAQLLVEQRFVFGDDAARRIHRGTSMVALTPWGWVSSSISRAAAPYRVARRSRTLASPTPWPMAESSGKPRPESVTVRRNRPPVFSARIKNGPALAYRFQPVLDGVFHQRKKHHGRDAEVGQFARQVYGVGKPRSHAHGQDIQIGAHHLHVAAQRGAGFAHLRDGGAQITDQVVDHFRRRGRVRLDQDLHVGQRVVEEVGLDLRLEQHEPRFGHLLAEEIFFRLMVRPRPGFPLAHDEGIAKPRVKEYPERDVGEEHMGFFDNQVEAAALDDPHQQRAGKRAAEDGEHQRPRFPQRWRPPVVGDIDRQHDSKAETLPADEQVQERVFEERSQQDDDGRVEQNDHADASPRETSQHDLEQVHGWALISASTRAGPCRDPASTASWGASRHMFCGMEVSMLLQL